MKPTTVIARFDRLEIEVYLLVCPFCRSRYLAKRPDRTVCGDERCVRSRAIEYYRKGKEKKR